MAVSLAQHHPSTSAHPSRFLGLPSHPSTSLPPSLYITQGIDIYSPKFNIVSPGADLDIYFPHKEVGGVR